MLNLFVGANIYGGGLAELYSVGEAGSLKDRRLTPVALCGVQRYAEKVELTEEQQFALFKAGKSLKGAEYGDKENLKRIAGLTALVAELGRIDELIASEEIAEIVTVYVPKSLHELISSGELKYYIGAEEQQGIYTVEELKLWERFFELYQANFFGFVFKSIDTCKGNVSKTTEQQERNSIHEYISEVMKRDIASEKARLGIEDTTEVEGPKEAGERRRSSYGSNSRRFGKQRYSYGR